MKWIAGAMVVALLVGGVALALHCNSEEQAKSSLNKEINTILMFYGVAVDQDGKALQGARFTIEVEAIPKDWSFDKRGEPHGFSTITATSGSDGRFQIEVTGHILRLKRVERSGYRHFFDLDTGASGAIDNTSYTLNAGGYQWYKSDVSNPAVYVFVKEGTQEVSVFPCAGGFQALGKRWIPNKPGWPKKPSLKDVVQKRPSTTGETSAAKGK